MLFKAHSAAVYGIDANLIDVEVSYSGIVVDCPMIEALELFPSRCVSSSDSLCNG